MFESISAAHVSYLSVGEGDGDDPILELAESVLLSDLSAPSSQVTVRPGGPGGAFLMLSVIIQKDRSHFFIWGCLERILRGLWLRLGRKRFVDCFLTVDHFINSASRTVQSESCHLFAIEGGPHRELSAEFVGEVGITGNDRQEIRAAEVRAVAVASQTGFPSNWILRG